MRKLLWMVLTAMAVMAAGTTAMADVETTLVNEINLQAEPLGVASGGNEGLIYILTKGEVLIYNSGESAVTDRFPVDAAFDAIAFSDKLNALILSSRQGKAVKLYQIDVVKPIDITSHPFKGAENAVVTIAVFDDYECPYCSRLEPLLTQVVQKYPEDVKLVIKNFPLSMHKHAQKAAQAALAAEKQGKYWEFHKKLFENFRSISDEKINEIATGLELDMEKFEADMNSDAVKQMIQKDMENGAQIGVRGTPTIFINGKQLKIKNADSLYKAIEAEIKKKKS